MYLVRQFQASLLGQYQYLRYLIYAKFFSIMAGRMLFTIMGWEVYSITKDPLSIGFIGLAEVIPAIVISLFAGNMIDVHSRKKIVVMVVIVNVVFASALTLASFILDAKLIVYTFYMYAFCIGLLRSFWGSTLGAIIPNIIPQKKIPKAASFSTGGFLIGSISGHALGGFLIANVTITVAFSVGILLFFIAFLNIIKLPKMSVALRVKTDTWSNIKEGLVYVYSNKIIFSALILDLFAVLFGGVVALLPVYAKDILFISPSLFGWLNAAMDIGASLGIIMMAIRPLKRSQGKIIILAVIGFGMCIITFGLSTNFIISFAALFLGGIFDSISMVSRGVILQSYVPDHIRGRVMSVNSVFIASSNELGQFESGMTARLMGVVPATIFGGIMTLCVGGIIALKSPKLRALQWKVD